MPLSLRERWQNRLSLLLAKLFAILAFPLIAKITWKLERADYSGTISRFHTVIELTFKPGKSLTLWEERLLPFFIERSLRSSRQYVCCNRAWQPGPKFQAFLHVHEFKDEQAFQRLLIKGFRVR